ncbi:MAG: DNA repair protein RecO [Flavobacteriaceae bacterium]|nr:MAG: DNA repair protein RecO [Flavobacteriaceae bacterium]
MISTTKAIVINSLKYGDTSLIVTCYTLELGVKRYMVKGILKAKSRNLKRAYFQPLTQLDLVGYHNNKGNLNTIKEAAVNYHYKSLVTQITKQTISFFISDILNATLREEEANPRLFEFITASMQWVDLHDDVANFHLVFLLNLTKFLGFYPVSNLEYSSYFDLNEGVFSESVPPYYFITGDKLKLFRCLLGIKFDGLSEMKLNSGQRHELLSILIKYFELHLEGFKEPKSLAILKTIFS